MCECLFIKVDKSLGAKKRRWVLCFLPTTFSNALAHPPPSFKRFEQTLVLQMLYNAIHQINHYLLDKY